MTIMCEVTRQGIYTKVTGGGGKGALAPPWRIQGGQRPPPEILRQKMFSIWLKNVLSLIICMNPWKCCPPPWVKSCSRPWIYTFMHLCKDAIECLPWASTLSLPLSLTSCLKFHNFKDTFWEKAKTNPMVYLDICPLESRE